MGSASRRRARRARSPSSVSMRSASGSTSACRRASSSFRRSSIWHRRPPTSSAPCSPTICRSSTSRRCSSRVQSRRDRRARKVRRARRPRPVRRRRRLLKGHRPRRPRKVLPAAASPRVASPFRASEHLNDHARDRGGRRFRRTDLARPQESHVDRRAHPRSSEIGARRARVLLRRRAHLLDRVSFARGRDRRSGVQASRPAARGLEHALVRAAGPIRVQSPPPMAGASFRFGPFVADRTGYRVLRGDRAVDVTPKLLDLLFHLLDHAGDLVTKEALLDALWPGANVTENALAQAVSELRQALGDDAASPRFIKTIARRGYRFIAPVEQMESGRAAAQGAAEPGRRGGRHREDSEGDRAIAVMDFANVSGDADAAWLSAGIAETVTSDLRALGHFRVVDRWRVVEVARRTDGSLAQVAADLHARLAVVGSFQRTRDRIRITARLVDALSGEALADAKVDGPMDGIFALQDQVVAQFASELGLGRAPQERSVGRDTASLDAYRAFSEGWLRLESLDVREMPGAIADFAGAVSGSCADASGPRHRARRFRFRARRTRACDADPYEADRIGHRAGAAAGGEGRPGGGRCDPERRARDRTGGLCRLDDPGGTVPQPTRDVTIVYAGSAPPRRPRGVVETADGV